MRHTLLFPMVLLAACAVDPPRQDPDALAASSGMQRLEIQADGFLLTAYRRITAAGTPLRLYIEGDGLAWITPTQPSSDPTPRHAVGLALAAADKSPNVAYLARPCQYSMHKSRRCSDSSYWTDKRFAPEVVAAMGLAVDDIKQSLPNQRIELVGYSGGAAIAVLLAARRKDIASLRTVAGNLDHVQVNRYHHVSDMPGSLNPIEVAARLASLPQLHFVGGEDRVIPAAVASSFLQRMGNGPCAGVVPVTGAGHVAGWEEAWPRLLAREPHC
jgi:pimeloyl-ACP methyl ester carboxylesterase